MGKAKLTVRTLTSFKHQATSNKQQATSNKQQATSNKQQATSNKQQAFKGTSCDKVPSDKQSKKN
jgi:hypothetical protein